ncbi:MAG: methyltransferase domain-containing protein [Caldilineales bacterium]
MTTQTWNPDDYARNAGFVARLGEPLIDLLAPQPGERVLDLGCGDGVLTEKLAAAGCIVVAVDGSTEQVAAARARGLDARVADGHDLPFTAEFDAVFSNAALHWMRAPDRVIAGVARALRPDGRFVGEMGGAGNIAAVWAALTAVLARRGVDAAALNPWYFPSAAEYRARLEAGGFMVSSIELFPRPTTLPGDIRGWLETFGGAFLSSADAAAREQIIDELREILRPSLQTPDGTWVADYVRLRFAATKRGAQ